MKKIILLLLSFIFLEINITPLFAANSVLDTILQPQLKVVDYNQKLESLKSNLLNSVSIFSDQTLFTQWANMLTSIGILLFIAVLIKVWLSIIYGSKDNMLKFIAFTVLLFFIWGSYAPLFSGISEFMTWEERTYTDPQSKLEYSRIYLPANAAIIVQPYYITDKWILKRLSDDINLFIRRGDRTRYSWEYLGIPGKVAQTQWQSDTDPTIRYSKAFYGVNLDTLFKWINLNLYIWNNAKLLWVSRKWNICSLTIQPDDFWTKWDKAPLSFLEAIWKWNYKTEADLIINGNNWQVKDPKIIVLDKFSNAPSITDISQDITIEDDCNKLPLGLYLMSNEYIKTLWTNSEIDWKKTPVDESLVKSRVGLREFLMNPYYGINFTKLSSLLEQYDYQNQKKLLYTFYAYSTLYYLTQKKWSSEVKEWSDTVKESILSCGRIVSWTVQSTDDYKKCLIVDQAWDTTIYTQETSRSLGLLGKNQNINKWYVLPVPTSIDWTKENLSNSYWDVKSLTDNGVLAAIWTVTVEAWSWIMDKLWTALLGNPNDWAITKWIKGRVKESRDRNIIETTLSNAGIKLENSDNITKMRVYQALVQKNLINSPRNWYEWVWVFNPFLWSFNSYDINGNWKVDYTENFKSGDEVTYYGYHYDSTPPSLYKDQVNFIQRGFYSLTDVSEEKWYVLFTKDATWESILKKKNDSWFWGEKSLVTYKYWNTIYFTPRRNQTLSLPVQILTPSLTSTNQTNLATTSWSSWDLIIWNQIIPSSPNSSQVYIWGNSTVSTQTAINQWSIIPDGQTVLEEDQFTIRWSDLFLGVGKTIYDITPINENWIPFSMTLKDREKKEYKYFPFSPDFSNLLGYYKDQKMILGNLYKFTKVGTSIWDWVKRENFIISNGTYKYYKWIIQWDWNISEIEWKSVQDYMLDRIKTLGTAWDDIYRVETKDGKKLYTYLLAKSQTFSDWKNTRISEIERLALMTNDTLNSSTIIYSFVDLTTWLPVSFNFQLERVISRIFSTNPVWINDGKISDSDLTKLNNLFGNTISQVGSIERQLFTDGGITYTWTKKEVSLQQIDFSKEKAVFSSTDEKKSITPRILLNSRLNIPLTYTPSNLSYLSDYKITNGVCLISSTDTDWEKSLFDVYPGLPKNALDKCSTVGDHMRLTDIRLQTFKQSGGLLAVWANKEVFTHYTIPLLTSKYIPHFTSDRRKQNYTGETKISNNLFSPTQISWVTVKEWDIFVLKPGVIVWAYSHPFTMLVPTALMPYIKYVKLDNPSEEIIGSHIYTWWIYDWLTSITEFLMDWKASQMIFGKSVTSETDEQKYKNFLQQKYDSRPDALKFIEGSVPDRYFHAYYGEGYINDSESGVFSGIWGEISEIILSFSTWLLSYRVEMLKWLYIFSPIIAFTLLFSGTRKIFSFSLALTIWLLILPVIILFFVNIFS